MNAIASSISACALGCALFAPLSASAQFVAAEANPSGNLADWAAHLFGFGADSIERIDFAAYDEGAVAPLVDLCALGTRLTSETPLAVDRKGRAEQGALWQPLSAGEGELGDVPTVLNLVEGAWSIVVSFRQPLLGAGVMTADLYNPSGDNNLVVTAFDGTRGEGAVLGDAISPAANFQLNRLLFLGVADGDARIRSIRIAGQGTYPDQVFIESIRFAVGPNHSALDGDVNMTGFVDDADVMLFSQQLGTNCVSSDLDGSGLVDEIDFALLMADYGQHVGGGNPGTGDGDEDPIPVDDDGTGTTPGTGSGGGHTPSGGSGTNPGHGSGSGGTGSGSSGGSGTGTGTGSGAGTGSGSGTTTGGLASNDESAVDESDPSVQETIAPSDSGSVSISNIASAATAPATKGSLAPAASKADAAVPVRSPSMMWWVRWGFRSSK